LRRAFEKRRCARDVACPCDTSLCDDRVYRASEVTEECAHATSLIYVTESCFIRATATCLRGAQHHAAASPTLTRCRVQAETRSRRPASCSRGQNRDKDETHKTIAVLLLLWAHLDRPSILSECFELLSRATFSMMFHSSSMLHLRTRCEKSNEHSVLNSGSARPPAALRPPQCLCSEFSLAAPAPQRDGWSHGVSNCAKAARARVSERDAAGSEAGGRCGAGAPSTEPWRRSLQLRGQTRLAAAPERGFRYCILKRKRGRVVDR
jgi:hypothetical protein